MGLFVIFDQSKKGGIMVPELTLAIMGQTLLGSVIIAFMYQKVKEWLHASGEIATVLAFVFGGLLGLLAKILGFQGPEVTIIYSILQGLVSAWVATGGYDMLVRKKS
jgi:hypothetical protein